MIEPLNEKQYPEISRLEPGMWTLLTDLAIKMREVIEIVNDLTMRADRNDDQLDDHGNSLSELEETLYGCDDDDECPGCCPTCGTGHIPSNDDDEICDCHEFEMDYTRPIAKSQTITTASTKKGTAYPTSLDLAPPRSGQVQLTCSCHAKGWHWADPPSDGCPDSRMSAELNAYFVTEDDGPLYEVVKRYKTGG